MCILGDGQVSNLRKVGGRGADPQWWRPVIPATSKEPTAIAVSGMSFEAALKELEGIVSRLEQGEVDLEDSIALYERGQALKNHCEAKLKAAEGRLEKIVLGAGGKPVASESLDPV